MKTGSGFTKQDYEDIANSVVEKYEDLEDPDDLEASK
jgi:hypothetical protein